MIESGYREELRSSKTSALFIGLALLFLGLFAWRVNVVGFIAFPIVCLCLGVLFVFYVLNYRILKITITEKAINLKFGLVPWKTTLENVAEVKLDDSPPLIKYGGAGVHFAFVKGKYRAFYNFLEHERVLISFHHKQGLVQELVFSTRSPDRVLITIQEQIKP